MMNSLRDRQRTKFSLVLKSTAGERLGDEVGICSKVSIGLESEEGTNIDDQNVMPSGGMILKSIPI